MSLVVLERAILALKQAQRALQTVKDRNAHLERRQKKLTFQVERLTQKKTRAYYYVPGKATSGKVRLKDDSA